MATFKNLRRIMTSKLTEIEKDKLIDTLLIFRKDEIEKRGLTLDRLTFNFSLSETQKYFNAEDEILPEGEDLTAFKKLSGISNEDFQTIINICQTHEYVENKFVGFTYKKNLFN